MWPRRYPKRKPIRTVSRSVPSLEGKKERNSFDFVQQSLGRPLYVDGNKKRSESCDDPINNDRNHRAHLRSFVTKKNKTKDNRLVWLDRPFSVTAYKTRSDQTKKREPLFVFLLFFFGVSFTTEAAPMGRKKKEYIFFFKWEKRKENNRQRWNEGKPRAASTGMSLILGGKRNEEKETKERKTDRQKGSKEEQNQ